MPAPQPSQRSAIATQTELPSTASTGQITDVYEIPKRRSSSSTSEDDTYETSDDGDVRRGFYEMANPYLKNRRFFNEKYVIQRAGDTFMIGNSDIRVDETGDITINGKRFRGTKGLWELLTCKNIHRDVITTSDLKRYKHIVELTNAHLVGYEPGSDIQISRGSKFTKVISKLFPQSKRRGTGTALRQRWVTY